MQRILDLSDACSRLESRDAVLRAGVPLLREIAGAASLLVLSPSHEPGRRVQVTHHDGQALALDAGVVTGVPTTRDEIVSAPVPAAWAERGIRCVGVRRLHELGLVVVLAWTEPAAEFTADLRVAFAMLDGHLARTATADLAEYERQHALEINDNVVQGLVAASYALDEGLVQEAAAFVARTLTAARAMMDSMIASSQDGGLQAGSLVRSRAATIGAGPDWRPAAEEPPVRSSATVLVVDDADDLRRLMRLRMESRGGLDVVGEAADGLAAVEMASELQPDLVMLDLAMPRMDGLQALPLIRAAVPGVRVIVLSGFNQATMAEKALAAGADEYVVKGGSMRQLLELVDSVLATAS